MTDYLSIENSKVVLLATVKEASIKLKTQKWLLKLIYGVSNEGTTGAETVPPGVPRVNDEVQDEEFVTFEEPGAPDREESIITRN